MPGTAPARRPEPVPSPCASVARIGRRWERLFSEGVARPREHAGPSGVRSPRAGSPHRKRQPGTEPAGGSLSPQEKQFAQDDAFLPERKPPGWCAHCRLGRVPAAALRLPGPLDSAGKRKSRSPVSLAGYRAGLLAPPGSSGLDSRRTFWHANAATCQNSRELPQNASNLSARCSARYSPSLPAKWPHLGAERLGSHPGGRRFESG
jgi:hypothetical protein